MFCSAGILQKPIIILLKVLWFLRVIRLLKPSNLLIGVAIEEYQEIHSMDMPESILKRELANFTSFVIQNFLIKTYTIQIYF